MKDVRREICENVFLRIADGIADYMYVIDGMTVGSREAISLDNSALGELEDIPHILTTCPWLYASVEKESINPHFLLVDGQYHCSMAHINTRLKGSCCS